MVSQLVLHTGQPTCGVSPPTHCYSGAYKSKEPFRLTKLVTIALKTHPTGPAGIRRRASRAFLACLFRGDAHDVRRSVSLRSTCGRMVKG